MFPPEKLGLEKRTENKKLTGADYTKPDELLVNNRTAINNLMENNAD
jgi:hypothetical protein